MTRPKALLWDGPILPAIPIFLIFANPGLGFVGTQELESKPDLYQRFRDPPARFGLMPYWFWNGRITPEETRRQMRLMLEQGVIYGILPFVAYYKFLMVNPHILPGLAFELVMELRYKVVVF